MQYCPGCTSNMCKIQTLTRSPLWACDPSPVPPATMALPAAQEVFAQEGVRYSIGGLTGNTYDSHRLIAWAEDNFGPAKQNALVEELFKSYFTEVGSGHIVPVAGWGAELCFGVGKGSRHWGLGREEAPRS